MPSSRGNVADRLASLGLALPSPKRQSSSNRTSVAIVGNMAYVSGHGPDATATAYTRGQLGRDLDPTQGRDAARACMLSILGSLNGELESLDSVIRVVRITGYVSCTPDFARQPEVIDGASDLLTELWGPSGVHARTAIGVSSLPNGIPVEIEGIFEVNAHHAN